MKRFLFLSLCFLFLFPVLAYAENDSRTYEFELSVNGKQMIEAEPGDIITVSAYLHRTDSEDKAAIYAIQDEIHYDCTLLELVDNGAIMANGIVTTDIGISDTERAFYITFASFSGGEEWEADKLLGCFQMRVLGDTGTAALTQENCLVSNKDGSDSYETQAKDLLVKIPFAERARETIAFIAIALIIIVVVLIVLVLVKKNKAHRVRGKRSKH